VIVDGIKYKGTPGLYELIFKRIPDDTIYTENDKLAYKSILLATNAHRRSHKVDNSGQQRVQIQKYNSNIIAWCQVKYKLEQVCHAQGN